MNIQRMKIKYIAESPTMIRPTIESVRRRLFQDDDVQLAKRVRYGNVET